MASPLASDRSAIPTPNSSRKRAPSTALTRFTTSPSHISKMATIFHDAAKPLHDIPTPSRPWSSNTKMKRTRIQARNIHFGTFYPESIRGEAARTGPVQGLESKEISYPSLPQDTSPTSTVNAWLSDISPTPSPVSKTPTPVQKQRDKRASSASSSTSDKENRPPSTEPYPPVPANTTPARPLTPTDPTTTARHRSSAPSPSPKRRVPRTPPGGLRQPPKRPRANAACEHDAVIPVLNEKVRFEIYEDGKVGSVSGRDEDTEVVPLSPVVDVYRRGGGSKGRRERRDRCGSYWDEDVIPLGSAETEPSDSEDDEMLDFTERKNKKEMPVSVERRSPRAMKRDHHPDNPGAQEKRFEFMVGKKGRRLS